MSRNLYKSNHVVLQENTKYIDNNERMAKMLERLSQIVDREQGESSQEGFVQGLPGVDGMDSIFMDEESVESGNVIKAASIPSEEELRAQAEELLESARQEAEALKTSILESAQAEAERLRQSAREEGYRLGTEQAERELERAKGELEQKAREQDESYQKSLDEMEPAIVDALTEVYEHIFHVELNQYRQILIQLISSTMRKVEENKNFLVHVAKEDYAFVSMNKRSLQESCGSGKVNIEIIEDITLNRNQCMLETENGIFDCGLDTQLGELTRKLRLLSYERKSQ